MLRKLSDKERKKKKKKIDGYHSIFEADLPIRRPHHVKAIKKFQTYKRRISNFYFNPQPSPLIQVAEKSNIHHSNKHLQKPHKSKGNEFLFVYLPKEKIFFKGQRNCWKGLLME